MKKISIVKMVISLAIPLIVGGISAALSSEGMASYGNMNKPPLSPPAGTFPIAWTILYILMGFASYLIIMSEADPGIKMGAIIVYAIQLFMNFMWSIIFFNRGEYLIAFIWLLILLFVVILCAYWFFGIRRLAGYLLIPYILWLTFAAYLNFGAYWLLK